MAGAALRIVVLGMMGRCPFAGQTWLSVNWLIGLTRAGHEVWYVEDDTVWPYDPVSDSVCQGPTGSARRRSVVLPAGGHQNCPLMATGCAQ